MQKFIFVKLNYEQNKLLKHKFFLVINFIILQKFKIFIFEVLRSMMLFLRLDVMAYIINM